MENLLEAWKEFVIGKRHRKDVQEFEQRLMEQLFSLHRDLHAQIYVHSAYEAFNISDPKPRHIHKASVRDRLLHHALHRHLGPFFDRIFIADSFSCRRKKGTHAAMERFRSFAFRASRNHTRTVWVLKCDIKKFFASINQSILLDLLADRIPDKKILWLLKQIISSFKSSEAGMGLPLGNLTSQLFVNIYMHPFDQWMKRSVKASFYVRYADDFVILSPSKEWLEWLLNEMQRFLWMQLQLKLHPEKTFVQSVASGVDFLGWVHFLDHRVIRTSTKRRMLRNLKKGPKNLQALPSYLGLLEHGNAFQLAQQITVFSEMES